MVQSGDQLLGSIGMFGGNFAPRYWAFCDGQLLSIASNQALFSILGTTFGGDGRTTFGLPDLRGRVPIHPGTGPGLPTIQLGQRGGTWENFLQVTQLPAHTHTAQATLHGTFSPPTGGGNSNNPSNSTFGSDGSNIYNTGAPNVNMSPASASVTVGNTGSNQPINNMQPWLGIYYCVVLQGTFPSRS